jgi:hypothetical protein
MQHAIVTVMHLWYVGIPCLWIVVIKDTQELNYGMISDLLLRLTICLWMEGNTSLELGFHQSQQCLTKVVEKFTIVIGDV